MVLSILKFLFVNKKNAFKIVHIFVVIYFSLYLCLVPFPFFSSFLNQVFNSFTVCPTFLSIYPSFLFSRLSLKQLTTSIPSSSINFSTLPSFKPKPTSTQRLFRSNGWHNLSSHFISYERVYVYPTTTSHCLAFAKTQYPSLLSRMNATTLLTSIEQWDTTFPAYFLIDFSSSYHRTTFSDWLFFLQTTFDNVPCLDRLEPDTFSQSNQYFISNSAFVPLNERQYLNSFHKQQEDLYLWGLDVIDFIKDNLYTLDFNGQDVHVYALDSGLVKDHPGFGGRAELVYEAPGTHVGGADCTGHGTHVAGIIAGEVTGVAKKVWIHMLRVMGCENEFPNSNTLLALTHLESILQYPAIINLSIGSKPENGVYPFDLPLIQKFKQFVEVLKVPIIMAAGNLDTNTCDPIFDLVPDIIVVGSVDEHFVRAKSSNYGPCVDLFAPGENIWSHSHQPELQLYSKLSGTSQAAPFASGISALILQQHGSQLSPRELLDALISASSLKVEEAGPVLRRFVGVPLTQTTYETSLALAPSKPKPPSRGPAPSISLTVLIISTVSSILLLLLVIFGLLHYHQRRQRYRESKVPRPRPMSEATLVSSTPPSTLPELSTKPSTLPELSTKPSTLPPSYFSKLTNPLSSISKPGSMEDIEKGTSN